MTKEAVTCPFCGAPYREIIPADTVQVKCNYCGVIILVPPHLGGIARQCPNHPQTLAAGICNDCGQSFCTRCLYVFNIKSGKLYICAKCYENRNHMKSVAAVVSLALALIFFAAIPFLLTLPRVSSDVGGIARVMLGAISLLTLSAIGFSRAKKMPPSVYEMLSQGLYAQTPKSFLKKCVKCSKEIPIASEECLYCAAKQP
ncbi:MAG: hypothetical protein QW667_07380 [Candidatus Bathyarchaeia archaeon]